MTDTPGDQVRDRQQQIASDLRALILSGDLAPGHQLPATAALVKQYGVTNQTVQRALRILKEEGFIEGQTGRGVFSTGRRPYVIQANHYSRPASPGKPYPWITDPYRRDRRGSSQLLAVGERPAPAQVAAAFGIATGDPVVMRHQLLLLDDEPAELVWLYFPVELARGTPLANPHKIQGGTPAVLTGLGLPPRHAMDQVGTRLATVEEFIALQLPENMPVLRQLRVVYTDGDRPVEVAVIIKAGHQYEIQYSLPCDRGE
ncbi:GntR family transcriptional regulator [Micromonospora sonneratiae]|uniref:GntR family transcriptional regulator n=1 Tax=Micromonospora sonneratiae TaxID=1184706 RepID=A0ABW3YI71_9ACTN